MSKYKPKEHDSFIFYQDWAEMVEDMTNEDAGLLLKAMCRFQFCGEVIKLPYSVKPIFSMIRNKMIENHEKWEARREQNKKNRANGSARVDDSSPMVDQEARRVTDNVNVNGIYSNERNIINNSIMDTDKFSKGELNDIYGTDSINAAIENLADSLPFE